MYDTDSRGLTDVRGEDHGPERKTHMNDIVGQLLPDVRGEDMANLVRNRAGTTALDRIMSLNSSGNTFNNFISADLGSDIR